MGLTEVFDNGLGCLQLVTGHTWEQMMLNLIIQATVAKVGHRMSMNIASCQYLPVQEVHRALFFQYRHAFMIRRKNRAEVETSQRLVHKHEEDARPQSQQREHAEEIEENVSNHQNPFEHVVLRLFLPEEMKTVILKTERDRQQGR